MTRALALAFLLGLMTAGAVAQILAFPQGPLANSGGGGGTPPLILNDAADTILTDDSGTKLQAF